MKDTCSLYQPKHDRIILKTASFKRSCRYHRKQGQNYQADDLLPKGFCPRAYAKIYPYALALLYNPQLKSEIVICPNKNFQVKFLLSSTFTLPPFIRKLKKFSLFCLNKVGWATEFPDKKISIEVKRTDNRCPKGFANGDTFTFNIWRRKELCPASFYAMYPFYLLGSIPSFHCPDPQGVSYETPKGDFSCQKVLPGGKIKNNSVCPLLAHTLFPYYLTLKAGGNFEWTKPGENVQVQCPHRQGLACEVCLSKKNKSLQVKIIKAEGACFLKIKKGQTIFLCDKDFDQNYFYQ